MSGLRGIVKEGWHPKGKEGGKESWRGDFKGINQVAGWMGKGKDPSAEERAQHVSRPLASLKDPASFGPPPKRNGPSAINSSGRTSSTSTTTSSTNPGTAKQSSYQAEETESRPAPPPLPYRANRTGLETDHLPPPPARRTDAATQDPPSPGTRPSVPPRLPARTASSPQSATPPPPPYSETDNTIQMNQGAVSRLGQAGVSVPALGIGRTNGDQSSTAQTNLNKQVNELHSQFDNMSMSSPQAPQDTTNHVANSRNATTYGEQQEQFRTPQSVVKRSPSASAMETRSMGATANNLRQRGGEQFEAGKKKLSAFNQKHKITERIQSYFEPGQAPSQEQPVPPPPPPHPNLSRQNSNIDVEALNKRKPPPPPPPAKKPGLQSKPVNSSTPSPPPLPLGTKPR